MASARAETGGHGVSLFGIRFLAVDLAGAVAAVIGALEAGERGYAVTPNVDHVVRYRRDMAFRQAYESASFCFADGMPIVWASRWLGRPLPARVAGADLLPGLCEAAAACGRSVFLLGGDDGVAPRAAANLLARFPGLRVAGTHTPPPDFGATAGPVEAALAAVAQATPDILFVGLGSPKQELWVHAHWGRIAATVAVCCGAAIDFAAGVRARAPVWVQRLGFEWLWRLAHEPRRLWRRYLVDDAAFLGILLREWWHLRGRREPL
ncbi:MAG: WecB/TagA/CpsF family glycosyltransferase [Armatimonadota bacterium]|nr:WecB/TagA/CpsF family glycosyltransferase [Armatimonadota bacterium]